MSSLPGRFSQSPKPWRRNNISCLRAKYASRQNFKLYRPHAAPVAMKKRLSSSTEKACTSDTSTINLR